jgi:hypothetical protein
MLNISKITRIVRQDSIPKGEASIAQEVAIHCHEACIGKVMHFLAYCVGPGQQVYRAL